MKKVNPLVSNYKDNVVQDKIKKIGNLPAHIAIIMDGNGRWAKERGMSRTQGHKAGINSVRDIVEVCGQLGIKYLTLYTFSTENWNRPKDEVSVLMKLLVRALRKETDKLNKNNVRLTVIGDTSTFPESVQKELRESIEKLKNNNGLTLNLALSYSGRWDILQAVKKILEDTKINNINPDDITIEKFNSYLATRDIPDPDLLIRTSGEHRISNFLLWQIAYTELYISQLCWPEFRRQHLYKAISDYQKRERRFGMVSEQLNKS
jgi:undecaprenyl diphosphate synthase